MKEIQIENALNYLAKGYSVIPVALDKRPLISWKDFQTRRASIPEVLGWFDKYPRISPFGRYAVLFRILGNH